MGEVIENIIFFWTKKHKVRNRERGMKMGSTTTLINLVSGFSGIDYIYIWNQHIFDFLCEGKS